VSPDVFWTHPTTHLWVKGENVAFSGNSDLLNNRTVTLTELLSIRPIVGTDPVIVWTKSTGEEASMRFASNPVEKIPVSAVIATNRTVEFGIGNIGIENGSVEGVYPRIVRRRFRWSQVNPRRRGLDTELLPSLVSRIFSVLLDSLAIIRPVEFLDADVEFSFYISAHNPISDPLAFS
jgi:hypothetical protein